VITPDLCGEPIHVVVPSGRRTIRTVVTSSTGKRDLDSLTLECQPPAANQP